MTKQEAIELFGSRSLLGAAMGIRAQAISLWPVELDQRQADAVIGAAIRLGVPLSDAYLANAKIVKPVLA